MFPRSEHHKLLLTELQREEKFFSNAVTHVVTTRSIPAQQEPDRNTSSSTTNESNSQYSQLQTINPSLLDRSSESTNSQTDVGSKGKFTFEVPINRRLATQGHDVDPKRQQVRNSDVLLKARALGIKIWALEKLQRMMTTMFDTDTGYQVHGHNTRGNSVSNSIPRATREADLSQLLRNERLNGPSDRDLTVATKEMTLFKGPFIYIHDIDEKQKPIMVREYPKVSNKGDGEWPQFRSVANGKCPFIEEVDTGRAEREKDDQLRLQRQQEKEQATAPRTRTASAVESKMQPPRAVNKRALSALENGTTRNATIVTRQVNPYAPAKYQYPQRNDQEASSRGNAFVSRAGAARHFAGEPVASGLQQSALTSAIQSQVTSSTAAQPGGKAGTNKEIHGLQRKVLERNSGGPGSYGLASSHRMTDLTAAARDEPAKRKAQHKLALIEEDIDPSENEEAAQKTEVVRKAKAVQQRKLEKREPKPGYCENCQDKFEDFDEVCSIAQSYC